MILLKNKKENVYFKIIDNKAMFIDFERRPNVMSVTITEIQGDEDICKRYIDRLKAVNLPITYEEFEEKIGDFEKIINEFQAESDKVPLADRIQDEPEEDSIFKKGQTELEFQ